MDLFGKKRPFILRFVHWTTLRRWFFRVFCFFFGVSIALILVAFSLENDDSVGDEKASFGDRLVNTFLFQPTKFHPEQWQMPKFPLEEVWLTTPDGVRILAWYLPAKAPKGVVLYSHGNAGNLSDWVYAGEELRKKFNVSVLVYDYRGYGKSDGEPSVPGILLDARAARDWLCQKTNLKPEDLIYFGRSLGGAVAIDLAAETGAKGLVIQSNFTSIPDIAKAKFPILANAEKIIKHKLDSLSKMKEYTGPLLLSHGDADTVIPYEQGVRLFDASPSEKKKFLRLKNLDHNSQLPNSYDQELGKFLRSL